MDQVHQPVRALDQVTMVQVHQLVQVQDLATMDQVHQPVRALDQVTMVQEQEHQPDRITMTPVHQPVQALDQAITVLVLQLVQVQGQAIMDRVVLQLQDHHTMDHRVLHLVRALDQVITDHQVVVHHDLVIADQVRVLHHGLVTMDQAVAVRHDLVTVARHLAVHHLEAAHIIPVALHPAVVLLEEAVVDLAVVAEEDNDIIIE